MFTYFSVNLKILSILMIYKHFLYLDPGTGSLIFQTLISIFLTVVLFFKRILNFLKFNYKKKSNKDED